MESILYTPSRRTSNRPQKAVSPFQKLVAPIYQFGRTEVIEWLHFITSPSKILQVGDSSYTAERKLRVKFPSAEMIKMDFVDMAIDQKAKSPFALDEQESENDDSTKFDLILMSYQLSYRSVDWKSKIRKASEMLATGGQIALVDYHGKFKGPVNQLNAYQSDELEDFLFEEFDSLQYTITPAYAGLWNYFKFIGRKNNL